MFPSTLRFDRLPGQFCRLLERIAGHYIEHCWPRPIGGPDRLVTIAASSGDVAADSLQHIVGCVLHLPLEEARIAAEAGALRLLVTAQQVKRRCKISMYNITCFACSGVYIVVFIYASSFHVC